MSSGARISLKSTCYHALLDYVAHRSDDELLEAVERICSYPLGPLECSATSVDSGRALGRGSLTLSCETGTFELQLPETCERGFLSTFSAKEARPGTVLCESDRFRRLELHGKGWNIVVLVELCFQKWMEKQCLRAAQALQSEFSATLRLGGRTFPVAVTWAETEVVLCCKKSVFNEDHLQNVLADLGLDVAVEKVLGWKKTMREESKSCTAWELQYSIRLRNRKLGSARNVDSHWYVINPELPVLQLEVNAGATGLSELLARCLESLGQGTCELDDILEQALQDSFLDRDFRFLSGSVRVRTAHPSEPLWVNATTLVYRKPMALSRVVPSANDQIQNFFGEFQDEIEQKIKGSEFVHIRRSGKLGDSLDFNDSDEFLLGKFQGMMAQNIGGGQALLCVCYDGAFDPEVAEKDGQHLARAVWQKITAATATGISDESEPFDALLVGLSDGCVLSILLCSIGAVASFVAGNMAHSPEPPAYSWVLGVGGMISLSAGSAGTALAVVGSTVGSMPAAMIIPLIGGAFGAAAAAAAFAAGFYALGNAGAPARDPRAAVQRQEVLDAMHMQQAMGEVRRHIPNPVQAGPEVQQAVILAPHAVQNFVAPGEDEGQNAMVLDQRNGGNAQEGQPASLAPPTYEELRLIIPQTEAWLQQNMRHPQFAVIRAYVKLNTCGLLLLCNSETIYQLAQQHGEKFSEFPVLSSRRSQVRHHMLTLGRLLHEDIGFPICTSRQTLTRGQEGLAQLKRFRVNPVEPPLDIERRLSRLEQRVSEQPGSAQSVEMIETTLAHLQGAQAAFETLIPQIDGGTLTEGLISQAARGLANQAGREVATWMVGGLLRRIG
eukprot:s2899_g5.t1